MKKNYGKKILKSKKEDFTFEDYYLVGVLIVFTVLFLSIAVLNFYKLTISPMTSFEYIMLLGFTVIISILSFFLILVLIMIIVKYLIIYESGILIRREDLFTFLKRKYIPFNQILDVEIVKEGDYERDILIIYIKSQKPYKLKNYLVSNHKEAKGLILKHIKN